MKLKFKNICKHQELEYRDTIEATTMIMIREHDELGKILDCNNEYGRRVREDVYCLECGKHWKIGKRTPKIVADFIAEIERLR